MKLASFTRNGAPGYGLVRDDHIVNLKPALGDRYPDLKSLLHPPGLALAARTGGEAIPLTAIEWLPPIGNPDKIICVGLNYADHATEVNRPRPQKPVIFTRFANSQTGHLQPIVRPRESTALDYEGELVLVIGHGGRRIARDKAFDHVAGYSIYNDASVRDWQKHSGQYTPGKNFPATGAFGPWIVTTDEIRDVTALTLTTRLNGRVMQRGFLRELIFPLDELVAYISTFTELATGDVIVTGTPPGVGDQRKPPVYMHDGDTVEVDIDGIGTLTNPVKDEAQPLPRKLTAETGDERR